LNGHEYVACQARKAGTVFARKRLIRLVRVVRDFEPLKRAVQTSTGRLRHSGAQVV